MKTGRKWGKLLLCNGLFLILIFPSCGNRNFLGADSNDYQQLAEKVKSLDFEIENEWANPLGGSRINLIGNANYIRFKNDSVEVFLPFYGERHSGGVYNSEGAIIYDGPVENLRIDEMAGRGRIKMFFSGDHNTENLDFYITFFPGGKTSASVNSSQRDRMGYEGRIINKETDF